MARIEIDPNYSTPTFSRATAATDIFKKEDVQLLAEAISTHNHTAGKGLAITSASFPDGSISGAAITDGTITSVKIADGTIQAVDIADGVITAAKIADGTIATAELAANAVSQVGAARPDVNFTTTSTSNVDVTGASVTLTFTGGRVLAFFSGPARVSTGIANFVFDVDGVPSSTRGAVRTTIDDTPMALVYDGGSVAAGSHTVKLRTNVSGGGTLTMNFSSAAHGQIIVVELKR